MSIIWDGLCVYYRAAVSVLPAVLPLVTWNVAHSIGDEPGAAFQAIVQAIMFKLLCQFCNSIRRPSSVAYWRLAVLDSLQFRSDSGRFKGRPKSPASSPKHCRMIELECRQTFERSLLPGEIV